MKKLGIVICNYNKKEYLINCIESIFRTGYVDVDIYVVDNASTDGSSELIKEKYNNNEVILLENKENLGGSGGFNTGLRAVIDKGYQYVMLLDNDVELHKDAIKELIEFLDQHKDYGMVGSLLLTMDSREIVQELGADIDFKNYYIKPYYKGKKETEVPELVECDYVPACSLMVTGEALKKVGIMNEENFIYWDDIEWGYRFKLAGYRVGAYAKSVVWHKMGVATRTNTFGTYYFWRNRVKFFLNYINKNQIEDFCNKLFEDAFKAVFMSEYDGRYSQAKTIRQAISDALNNIENKALEDRIIPIEKRIDKLLEALKNDDSVELVVDNTNNKVITKLETKLKELGKEIVENASNRIILVRHITEVRDFELGFIYIDEYMNIAYTQEDFVRLREIDQVYNEAKKLYLPKLIKKACKYISR